MSISIEGPRLVSSSPANAVASTGRTGTDLSKPVAAATPSDSVHVTGEATKMYSVERSLRDGTGVDLARVARVRAALADGSYLINPEAIAEAIISLDRALFK
jgi:negative regulator of flagellin synthesis FlgM